MHIYIALGSNLDPIRHLDKALQLLTTIGVVQKISSRYWTEPLGGKEQPWYVNQVALLETALTPPDLLAALKHIEQALGRQPRGHWDSREIDLDILLYENQSIATLALQIPHPGLTKRRCVLVPMVEIAPNIIVPNTSQTIQQLLLDCSDRLQVKLYEPSQT